MTIANTGSRSKGLSASGGAPVALSVLVASCDAYSDLLTPFSELWRRFWPDCPYELVLATETQPVNASQLAFDRVVACGEMKSWGDRLVKAIDSIRTPAILMLCDDYLLNGDVDSAGVAKRLEHFFAHRALNLRLIPNPAPSRTFRLEEGLGEYDKDTAYCLSTLTGIWDAAFLRSMAAGRNSIWEFERLGSFACGHERRPLLCTLVKEFPFVDAVHKGKWERFGADLCQRNGIAVDFARRGMPSPWRKAIEWGKGRILAVNPTAVVKRQNRLGIGKK